MKALISILIMAGITSLAVAKFYPSFANSAKKFFSYSPCDEPVKYRIGTVDKRFGISQAEFSQMTNEAAKIWNEAAGRILFVFDPKSSLSVNLIFDERQSLAGQINQETEKIESQKSKLTPEIEQYQARLAEFERKLAEFAAKVNFWNAQGGAPFEEFQKLAAEQNQLKSEAERLNQQAASLNLSTKDLNSQISKLNSAIANFYSTLEDKPEEGIFKPEEGRIEIYFHLSKAETIHTIAHEFGHARGLQHLPNPKALMYGKTNTQQKPTQQDLAELERVCRNFGILESFGANLVKVFDSVF